MRGIGSEDMDWSRILIALGNEYERGDVCDYAFYILNTDLIALMTKWAVLGEHTEKEQARNIT